MHSAVEVEVNKIRTRRVAIDSDVVAMERLSCTHGGGRSQVDPFASVKIVHIVSRLSEYWRHMRKNSRIGGESCRNLRFVLKTNGILICNCRSFVERLLPLIAFVVNDRLPNWLCRRRSDRNCKLRFASCSIHRFSHNHRTTTIIYYIQRCSFDCCVSNILLGPSGCRIE